MGYKRVAIPFTKDQLRQVFYQHDKDGDGYLTKQELRAAFDYLGSRCSGFRVELALFHADANGDGYITRDEIEQLIDFTFNCNYSIA